MCHFKCHQNKEMWKCHHCSPTPLYSSSQFNTSFLHYLSIFSAVFSKKNGVKANIFKHHWVKFQACKKNVATCHPQKPRPCACMWEATKYASMIAEKMECYSEGPSWSSYPSFFICKPVTWTSHRIWAPASSQDCCFNTRSPSASQARSEHSMKGGPTTAGAI